MKQEDIEKPVSLGKVVLIHVSNMAETDKGVRVPKNKDVDIGDELFRDKNGGISVVRHAVLQKGVTEKLVNTAVDYGMPFEKAQTLSKGFLEAYIQGAQETARLQEEALAKGMTEADMAVATPEDIKNFLEVREPGFLAKFFGAK